MFRLKLTSGLLLSLLFSLSSHAASSRAASFEEACQSLPAVPLISVSTLPVTVESAIADDDMRTMTIRTTGAESLHELATVGTTFANQVWELSYGLHLLSDRATGRVCYQPAINVAIGYDPMRISVASPYRAGTCAYDMIVAHEYEHVRIYRDFLPTAAEAIEHSLKAVLSRNVRYAASAAAANAEVQRILRSEVTTTVRNEMARSGGLHNRFDSIEESLHMLNGCGGDVRRALDHEVLAWKSASLEPVRRGTVAR